MLYLPHCDVSEYAIDQAALPMIEYDDTPATEQTDIYDRLLSEYRDAQKTTTYTAVVHGEAVARENQAWRRLIEYEGRQGRKQN